MPNTLPRRNFLAFFAASALLLTGCSGFNGLGFSGGAPVAPAPPAGQAIGAGANKIGLILPLSGPGNSGATALSMRQAAELALAESQAQDTQILLKDDLGTPQGAQGATQAAISEGAQIVLGPLFAPSVSMAGQTARSAGIPVIAFSSDENVASPGVYLLSFLPSADVSRIVEFASTKGRKSYVALLPDDAYGTVAEAEFRTAVTRVGGRIIGMDRYAPDKTNIQAAVTRLAPGLKTGRRTLHSRRAGRRRHGA